MESHAGEKVRPLGSSHRQTLTDGVYEAVKELVMDHGLEPGARVSIDQLARDLDVSPTPVREALARLEQDGLLVKEPRRGYRTALLLDTDALEQLFELRALLEPHAARRAAERASKQDLASLGAANTAMRQAIRTAKKANESPYREYREFAAEDARFHDIVAAASGNALLRETLERLRPHVHLYRLYFRGGLASETLSEHEAVLSAIRAGLPAEAEAAMADHIERSRERLIERAAADRA